MSELQSWKSLSAIVLQWFWVAGMITLYYVSAPQLGHWAWAVYVMCVIGIASRQHCLLALMHEATHSRLCRNRAVNDFLSDMLCAFPLGISTELYRRDHLLHHQFTSTDKDPNWVGMQSHEDWHWPKDNIAALKLFALDLVGLAAHKTLLFLFMWSPLQKAVNKHLVLGKAERLRFISFVGGSIAILSVFHLWWIFLVFWVVPMVSVLGFLLRLRSVAEHSVMETEHELNTTRHVDATFLERLTLAPINVNFHLAHHLFPSVPFYNLPKLHRRLMEMESFRSRAHLTQSYLGLKRGVLSEVVTRRNS